MSTGTNSDPRSSLLVQPGWLEERLQAPDLQIVDVRAPFAQLERGYPWGHIPGAVNLDLQRVFTGRATGVRATVGPLDEVAAELERSSLLPDRPTIIYDQMAGPPSAQAFWLLEVLGFPDVRLLSGGFSEWRAAGHPVTTAAKAEPGAPANPQFEWDDDPTATLQWICSRLGAPDLAIVDTRTPGEYQRGHIPGAVLLPWEASLQSGLGSPLKSPDELSRLFQSQGITPDKRVVAYCQTGARSAHTYFVLRTLDYPALWNYDGSWEEWGDDPDTPKES